MPNMQIFDDTIEFPNGRRGMLSRWVAPCSDAQERACHTWNLSQRLQMEFGFFWLGKISVNLVELRQKFSQNYWSDFVFE